ncbi:MAG: hypothetical protein KDC88_00770 [Ignavibacteriae bacterium]|nr:hypothetical protein [Ignavibacteriota bacterium]MCB0745852.1 hypothetical protein [Ignavibacteriota bacterium]MCB9257714.1 hypothetical protein [Ignavibacteriales bacterium]
MAKRTLNIEFRTNDSPPLNPQFPIGQYDHPFTLNPTIGCFFGCKYCYSPLFTAKVKNQKRKKFFENVAVQFNMAERLDKHLENLKEIPQHLKRVQINESNEYYLPQVINELKKQYNRDVMLEILKVFEKHWDNGNKWMLHILSKSHLILNHLDQLKNMKHMVQIEISISSIDEKLIRDLEFYTPTIKKRMETINKLATNDIFVRTMAMPFWGDYKEVEAIKKLSFNNGARGFKNKRLNYFDWQQLQALDYNDLINDKVSRVQGRPDNMFEDLNEKSGETLLFKGKPKIVNVSFPHVRKWSTPTILDEKLSLQDQKIIDCGYSQLNKVKWAYIK